MKKLEKNNVTEIVFILDRSGSMSGLEKDTIGGFNSMLERQKKQDGKAYVSTILFDNISTVVHDRVPIEQVKPLTDDDYYVKGCTALLDAVGGAIHHIKNIHKYARKEDIPENTIFIITTDGMENASHNYSHKDVKKMIEKAQKKHNWEFIFLGANIDAASTAKSYGINENNAVNYHADEKGTSVIYESMCEAVSMCRKSVPLGGSWRSKVDEDYENRK